MSHKNRTHRSTIASEPAEVLSRQEFPGQQHVLRLKSPRCAALAEPGQFVHLQCHPLLPMRRPFSIMQADPRQGCIEILYKVVGEGTRWLANRCEGELLDVLGPVGRPFLLHRSRPVRLLIGGGVGIPPILFLAQRLHENAEAPAPTVLMGSEIPFPFRLGVSRHKLAGISDDVDAALSLLEDRAIPCRLASRQGWPGCYPGHVTELAQPWLGAQDPEALNQIELFACGPRPMLEAVAGLAHGFGVDCQVAVEEFMACGVGGCAGCIVPVQTPEGVRMKRACVDGPVFEAASVFPAGDSPPTA